MVGKQQTRSYRVWEQAEEEALRQGVLVHGLGAWEQIRKDPQFAVLSHRSGVQLKDKWRNLVKFRHVSVEESKKLKPKHSGPWSRKYSSSGPTRDRERGRERSFTPSSSRPSSKSGDDEEEPIAALLALEAGAVADSTADNPGTSVGSDKIKTEPGTEPSGSGKRYSRRAVSRNKALADYETLSDNEERPASDPSLVSFGKRKRRKVQEDRRFGIYDQRRYRTSAAAAAAAAARGGAADGSGEDSEEDQEFFNIHCCCGVTHNDGAAMIECEECQIWAHIECLRNQMAADPEHYSYNFDRYICSECQQDIGTAGGSSVRRQRSHHKLEEEAAGELAHGGYDGLRRSSRTSGRPLQRSSKTGDSDMVELSSSSGESEQSSRSSKDQTNELSSILLGLANATTNGWGDPAASAAATAPMTASDAMAMELHIEMFPADTRRGRKLRKRRQAAGTWGQPLLRSLQSLDASPPGFSGRYLEQLGLSTPSLFMSNKPSAKPPRLGPGRTPTESSTAPASGYQPTGAAPSAAAFAAAIRARPDVHRPSPSMAGSSPLLGVMLPAPKPLQHPALQRRTSQQSLENLVAAANACATTNPAAGGQQHHDDALTRSSICITHHGGRLSPAALLHHLPLLRRSPPLHPLGTSSQAPAATDGPPKQGPSSQSEVDAHIFGDSDEEGGHLHHQASLDSLKLDPMLLGMINSRASTPSHAYIDTLLRATPDISLASLLNPAAVAAGQLPVLGIQGLGPQPDGAHHPYALVQGLSDILLPLRPGSALGAHHPLSSTSSLNSKRSGLQQLGSGGLSSSTHSAAGLSMSAAAPSSSKAAPHSELHSLHEGSVGHLGLSIMDLHGRPGTPDPWGLMRTSTPSPEVLALQGFGSLPLLHDFTSAMPWLLSRTPPLPDLACSQPSTSAAALASSTAPAASSQQHPSSQQQESSQPAAAVLPVHSLQLPITSGQEGFNTFATLQMHHSKKASEDFAALGFNVEDMLRSNTPAPR